MYNFQAGKTYYFYHPDDVDTPIKVQVVSIPAAEFYVVVESLDPSIWQSKRFVTVPENLFELDSPELKLLLALHLVD